MFKFAVVFFALISCATAKPGIIAAAPLAYTALAAPAPIVTATSNQVIARNYNGIAAAPVVATAPVAAPVVARYAAAAPLAAASYVASPLSAPVLPHYAAAPIASSFLL